MLVLESLRGCCLGGVGGEKLMSERRWWYAATSKDCKQVSNPKQLSNAEFKELCQLIRSDIPSLAAFITLFTLASVALKKGGMNQEADNHV